MTWAGGSGHLSSDILIYSFGRNMAFNIANVSGYLRLLDLLMFWTFPKENRGE
jgi:hypothetical protein